MRKSLAAVLLIAVAVCCVLSACQKQTGKQYDTYFNNFVSTKGFVSVTEKVDLGENVFASSYDDDADLYITNRQISTGEGSSKTVYNFYGFATADGVIMEPRYAEIIDLNYNYAIVVKRVAEGTTTRSTIGLVRIRGDKAGKEFGFNYDYNSAATQYSFLNDKYLVMFGNKDLATADYTYATVYDYTTANGLLEVGRIGNCTAATVFSLYDGYLAALGKSIIRYYNFDKIDSNGYFELSEGGKYTPFKEEDGYADMTLVSSSIFYLGNGWFVETGIYTSTTEFTGYEQTKTVDSTKYYYVNRSTRYNVKSGKRFATDRVKLVANKYSSIYNKTLADTLNYEVNLSDADKLPLYFKPTVPVSEIIKDGYSIVYYEFSYYDAEDNLKWGQTFSIYDENADIILLDDLLMPLLFIDGYGLQTGDPLFSTIGGDIGYYTKEGDFVVLKAAEKMPYDPEICNDGMIVGYDSNLYYSEDKQLLPVSMMGAASVDGSVLIPFEYVELSMFVGGYAIGSKYVVTDKKTYREFYRISKTGVVTKIENVYCIKNGMYITKEGEKYGLFANDGTRLLEAQYTSISIIENYLVNGVYLSSRIVGIKNGHGIIFEVTTAV